MTPLSIFTSLQLQIADQTKLIYTILAVILTLAVLIGISLMSKVRKAVTGNLIGSVTMFLAIILTLWYYKIFTVTELWVAMLIGASIGALVAKNVKMIQMPQLVGLLNGFGGAASMIAGI